MRTSGPIEVSIDGLVARYELLLAEDVAPRLDVVRVFATDGRQVGEFHMSHPDHLAIVHREPGPTFPNASEILKVVGAAMSKSFNDPLPQ